MANRRKAQTAALVALLQSLPDVELQDVLSALDTKGMVVLETPTARPTRPCGVCGLAYPQCRRRWSDDHEYEAPEPKPARARCLACDSTSPCAPGSTVSCAHPHHFNGDPE